jgi:hypothetical protein
MEKILISEMIGGMEIVPWHLNFIGDCAMASQFYHLFQLCQQSYISVYEVVMSGGGQVLSFSRALTELLLIEFNALCNLISTIHLSLESDQFN